MLLAGAETIFPKDSAALGDFRVKSLVNDDVATPHPPFNSLKYSLFLGYLLGYFLGYSNYSIQF